MCVCRPIGRGVQGGSLEPPFWPPKYFIHCLALPFVNSPLASLPLTVQAKLVAAMYILRLFIEDQQMNACGTRAEVLYVERTHVNTCVNKSLFQVLRSSPVVESPPTMKWKLNSLESYHLSENTRYIAILGYASVPK